MTGQTLLVEIGTEELPPKSLATLAQAFAASMAAELANSQLSHGQVRYFASPRRLAVQIEQVATAQADSEIEKRGPALAQAFDQQGKATPAALGWAKGCGIAIEQASRLVTDKGEWLCHRAHVAGQQTEQLLPALIEKSLAQLPIPKMMRWADKTIQFIRPIHTVTVLLGEQLVKGTILTIPIDRIVRGHRFMGQAELTLDCADHYLPLLLEKGKVMADYQQRRALIDQQVQQAAQQLGGQADITPALLDEVTALVEWPVVLTARFEEKFLAVPSQALVHTMKSDQKYFPVYDAQGQLLPYFIFVSNIESTDPSQVIAGNEKVVRPRLADAEFFFNTDRQQRLEQRLPRLHQVLFQQQLGSLRDKTDRIQLLAAEVARAIGANVEQTERAALLAKCDLLTNMVFEFPETQGVMGMHYARHDGEDEAVANALNEQYQPRFAGDALPESLVACALAIADKLDSLVGIFGIGQAPKGDKDPFALRRAALGILRISVEKKLPIDVQQLVAKAMSIYQANQPNALTNTNTLADVVDFMLARFRHWYQELGYPLDSIAAVLARRPTVPYDFDLRIKAVAHFRTLPEAVALAAANKRVANILDKQSAEVTASVDTALLQVTAEKALWQQLCQLQPVIEQAVQQQDYQCLLTRLAGLRQGVDDFFANVMVMDNDLAIQTNRLALLQQLRGLFLQVADISLLQ